MARTKKNANITEQIKNVEVQIVQGEKKLKDLRNKRQKLLIRKETGFGKPLSNDFRKWQDH